MISTSFFTDRWLTTEESFHSDEGVARRSLLDERSRQISAAELPFTFQGYCSVCDAIRPIQFRSNHGTVDEERGMFHIAYSETGACTVCLVNSRQRFAVELLGDIVTSSQIYVTEHFTALRMRLALRYPALLSSEYFGPDVGPVGRDGVLNEDLHRLSFASESLDAVMALDVLEHVNDPGLALREITRVLKPGGRAVITFPFYSDRSTSLRRSELIGDSVILHHPAEYHGNPLGGGSLVYWELTWDFLRNADLGDESANLSVFQYWSALSLHLGASRFAFLIEKAPREVQTSL